MPQIVSRCPKDTFGRPTMYSISRFMTVLFTSAAVMVMPALAFAETPPSAESDGPLQLSDPDIVQKAKDQLGLGFPTNYQDEECVPVGRNDPCLDWFCSSHRARWAISRFGRLSFSSSKAKRSVPTNYFSRFGKHPKNAKALWLIAKNAYRAEKCWRRQPKRRPRFSRRFQPAGGVWKSLEGHQLPTSLWYTFRSGIDESRDYFSAANGDDVEDHWLRALETKEHYRFPSANTSVGAVNYGLGIFYRLVPDSWLMSLLLAFVVISAKPSSISKLR